MNFKLSNIPVNSVYIKYNLFVNMMIMFCSSICEFLLNSYLNILWLTHLNYFMIRVGFMIKKTVVLVQVVLSLNKISDGIQGGLHGFT